MKKLSVVVAGTGQIRDVEIQPGTTAGDILHQLNLSDYLLEQRSERAFLRQRRVGVRQGQETARRFSRQPKPRSASRYARERTRHPACPRFHPRAFSRGWCGGTPPPFPSSAARSPTGRNAAGRATATTTRVRTRRPTQHFKAGSKRNGPATSISTFIIRRHEIRSHSHWICFTSRGSDWYAVHMARRPKDVSSGIITIEQLIREAYER